jgi:hypothetical protein
MKKIVYVLAILAAGSTAAVAKDLKQEKKTTAPTVAATQMSDAEMDKVTAGFGKGFGIETALENPGRASPPPNFSPGAPGSGRCIHHGC